MKMKWFAFILAVLVFAVNVYAGGDLIVTGQLGVGADPPATTLDVRGKTRITNTNVKYGLRAISTLDQEGIGAGEYNVGAGFRADLNDVAIGQVYGLESVASLSNSATTARRLVGASFLTFIGRPNDPDPTTVTTVTETKGLEVGIARTATNRRTYNILNPLGFYSPPLAA